MRCYDGCPDSALQAKLDKEAAIRNRIKAQGFSVTYFPSGGFYQAFDADHLSVTGECSSLEAVEYSLPKEV